MAFFERAGRNALARLLGTLLPVRKKTPAEVLKILDQDPSPKILIIRAQQGLGDLLLATPVLRGIQERFPKSRIHFLAEKYNALAVENNRRLSRVWVWDKRAMGSML